jgi:hypothetical protein
LKFDHAARLSKTNERQLRIYYLRANFLFLLASTNLGALPDSLIASSAGQVSARDCCYAFPRFEGGGDMRNLVKAGALSAIVAAAAFFAPTTQSSAGVMSVADKTAVGQTSIIDKVHYRRYCRPHMRHVRWRSCCGYAYYPRWRYAYYPRWRYAYYPRWRYSYYPSWRYAYYPRWRYSYYPGWRYRYGGYGGYYNPAAAVAGAAVGLATSPLWGFGGGYPYYW